MTTVSVWRCTVPGEGPLTIGEVTFDRDERGVLDPQPEDPTIVTLLEKHPCFQHLSATAPTSPPDGTPPSRIYAKILHELDDSGLQSVVQIGPVITSDLVKLTVRRLKLLCEGAIELDDGANKRQIVQTILDSATHEWATKTVPDDDAPEAGGGET